MEYGRSDRFGPACQRDLSEFGDSVQAAHQAQWRARWAVELSWDTFTALGLDRANAVEVYAIE